MSCLYQNAVSDGDTTPLVNEISQHSQTLCRFVSHPIDMNRPGEPCIKGHLPLNMPFLRSNDNHAFPFWFYELARTNLTRPHSPNKHSTQYLPLFLFLSSLMGLKIYLGTSYHCYNITPCHNPKELHHHHQCCYTVLTSHRHRESCCRQHAPYTW